MIDLAWPPGIRIAARASDGTARTGTLLETGLLAGYRVAYVRWDSLREAAAYIGGVPWLDTVLLATIIRREVAA